MVQRNWVKWFRYINHQQPNKNGQAVFGIYLVFMHIGTARYLHKPVYMYIFIYKNRAVMTITRVYWVRVSYIRKQRENCHYRLISLPRFHINVIKCNIKNRLSFKLIKAQSLLTLFIYTNITVNIRFEAENVEKQNSIMHSIYSIPKWDNIVLSLK